MGEGDGKTNPAAFPQPDAQEVESFPEGKSFSRLETYHASLTHFRLLKWLAFVFSTGKRV